MNPCQYIILNKGAKMSTGKAAAQAAHASVEAYIATPDNNTKRVWHKGGHYMKVVLEAQDADDLIVKQKYIEDRGFATKLIIDEGRTEIDPFTPTALGVEILDKDHPHVAATFSSFKLYKDEPLVHPPTSVINVSNRLSTTDLKKIRKQWQETYGPPGRLRAFFSHRPFKRGWDSR